MAVRRSTLGPVASAVAAVLVLGLALGLASTGRGPGSAAALATGSPRVVAVVAAEDFWGSIAAQLGGAHARVTSLVTSPDADPHSYEPSALDAARVATAQLVIDNGLGYDPWAGRLLGAGSSATVLDVGRLLGLVAGDNPHRWYDPADTTRVVAALAADLARLDPADAAYFAARRAWFESSALARYDGLIAAIRARYSGTPVGASESIFAMVAPALGLRVITPPSFLKAISEGSEVSAADKEAIDAQIRTGAIKVYVYNRQNLTPDVSAQLGEVRARGIPAVAITETLSPASATYQDWQADQLAALESALAAATGRSPS
ncbi:MAG TPA: zinc ABC transporter substrate-binding protein [Acidimicrobiales bacterium]|nr:zinc ABC transporter substrate-binding protein [Acidimicrobiales bacterium]